MVEFVLNLNVFENSPHTMKVVECLLSSESLKSFFQEVTGEKDFDLLLQRAHNYICSNFFQLTNVCRDIVIQGGCDG